MVAHRHSPYVRITRDALRDDIQAAADRWGITYEQMDRITDLMADQITAYFEWNSEEQQ